MRRMVIVIAVLALLVAACSSGGSTATTAPSSGVDGKAIYTAKCAACHGANLEGGVGKALDANSPAAGDPDAELLGAIENGVAGTAMPAFSDEEIRAVLDYIRSVQNG
ncbi:MAG: c-type cytochrome [Actinobacteria bacterium]|nr:c-type cytochrome [Actinomycetota bacterium]